MTAAVPPVPAITGPKPFGIDITDPLAFLLQEYDAAVEKVVSLLGPSAPPAAGILAASVQAAWVLAILRDPLNGKDAERANDLIGFYKAKDTTSLITWYNDVPLHPDWSRVFARVCLILLGVPVSAFPS